MFPFKYVRATDEATAIDAARAERTTQWIAGGTTLVDLMRLEVMRPAVVVDINPLPLAKIAAKGDGVLIGAMVRNSELATHPMIAERYPLLAQALLSGASPQLRNMATVGGNLMQRTRCPYFRDLATACNKREPGTGCSAMDGYTRSHAVLGTSASCIATHPSDMCVALVALDAVIHAKGPAGERTIAMAELHTLPGNRPEVENVLKPGELITGVELPPSTFAKHSHYLKVRDRASYAFALASCGAALDLAGTTVRDVRIALGGVATKPWRAVAAEKALVGRAATLDNFRQAAVVAMDGAVARGDNAFKIELARRTIVRALTVAGGVS